MSPILYHRRKLLDASVLSGYLWAVAGVTTATGLFWLVRGQLDPGQASLLYLPVVIACAIRFGFGPAVLGAILSFFCWDFFFIPPLFNILTDSPRNWLSLLVFLAAAITTAHLASGARGRAREAEARERETSMLYQASEVLSREVDAECLLQVLVDQVVRICQASRCLVWRRTASDVPLELAAAAIQEPLPDDTELLIRQAAEDIIRSDWRSPGATQPPLIERSEEEGLYIPLQVQKEPVGALHVGPRRDGQIFSAQDERLIMTLANHAAVVIARQTLAEEARQQAQQAAVLEERNRLARDVHDTLSHAFTGIKFLLEAAQRVGPTPQTMECIGQARKLAVEGAQEARRSVWALRSAVLEEAGDLAAAVRRLVHQQTAGTPLRVVVSITGEPQPLPSDVEENLLRICQEAVTNVLRHARANRVEITLTFKLDELTLSVQDDGCGFAPGDKTSQAGFGLISMAERGARLGADLSVESQPNQGTLVRVCLPILAVREEAA